jgi:hypothetical protein
VLQHALHRHGQRLLSPGARRHLDDAVGLCRSSAKRAYPVLAVGFSRQVTTVATRKGHFCARVGACRHSFPCRPEIRRSELDGSAATSPFVNQTEAFGERSKERAMKRYEFARRSKELGAPPLLPEGRRREWGAATRGLDATTVEFLAPTLGLHATTGRLDVTISGLDATTGERAPSTDDFTGSHDEFAGRHRRWTGRLCERTPPTSDFIGRLSALSCRLYVGNQVVSIRSLVGFVSSRVGAGREWSGSTNEGRGSVSLERHNWKTHSGFRSAKVGDRPPSGRLCEREEPTRE